MTSSNSMRFGCIARARTIATRCCCPPDSLSGYSSRLSARPKRARSSSARDSASALESPSAFRGPSVMFATTDMCGKRLKDWKTIPIPRRTSFTSTRAAVISSPRTTIRPLSTGSSRFTQRRSVDFPEPDAPMRQTTSCSASVRSIPRSTSSFPKLLCTPSRTSAEASVLTASRPRAGAAGPAR